MPEHCEITFKGAKVSSDKRVVQVESSSGFIMVVVPQGIKVKGRGCRLFLEAPNATEARSFGSCLQKKWMEFALGGA